MLRAASRLVGCLALFAATVAGAAAPGTVFVEELTWTELRDAVRAGATTVVVPVGGTEQNGPHMTLGKHNARVRALSERVARELGNALVAPVLAYVPEGGVDPPTAHMRFPGTITVPDSAFEKVVEGAARSFRLHGFRDVVLLGDHGGYRKSLGAVADRMNREWRASSARVHAIDEYYEAVEAGFAQALRGRGFRDDEIGTHAGLADTSLALAVDSRIVRTDRLQEAASAGRAGGVYGDPRRATAELGRLGADAIVAATVNAVRLAVARRR